jgi:WS/DGAT/MGAT family acyltransferase
MFLRLETAAWPCHFGGLAVLEGKALLDAAGQLRLQEIRDRLDRRLSQVPKMRQRVYFPGPLGGRPLWVDDDQFAIENHVHQTTVEHPGGDGELLETATSVYERLLDRSRPLWELWFLTGLSDDRVGVILKLHHSMADGLAAVAIMGSLFDTEPDAPEPAPAASKPEPVPETWQLVADNLLTKVRTTGRSLARLAHPVRFAGELLAFARLTRRYFGARAAPASSLNQPVKQGRRVGVLRLDLETLRTTAHTHRGKINDVVLALWAGGLRHVLTSRGERVAGVELITGMAATSRSRNGAAAIDNEVGTIVLPLPLSEPDVRRRLDLVVPTTQTAKREQRPKATLRYLAGLAATPIGRYFTAHQRSTNVIVTNVMGPSVPIYLLGTRVLEILPIIELIGNIGLTLCAFSYAGRMYLVVTADASSFPDLDLLMEGMERDWDSLVGEDCPDKDSIRPARRAADQHASA